MPEGGVFAGLFGVVRELGVAVFAVALGLVADGCRGGGVLLEDGGRRRPGLGGRGAADADLGEDGLGLVGVGEGVAGGEAEGFGEDGRHAVKVELDAEGGELVGHPWSCQTLLEGGEGGEGHTSEGDVGELLVVPSAADVGVGAREPDLLEVGLAAGETLPESRTKGVARLVEAEGLECVFDLVRDLGIGEAPCLGLLVGFPESSEDRETY